MVFFVSFCFTKKPLPNLVLYYNNIHSVFFNFLSFRFYSKSGDSNLKSLIISTIQVRAKNIYKWINLYELQKLFPSELKYLKTVPVVYRYNKYQENRMLYVVWNNTCPTRVKVYRHSHIVPIESRGREDSKILDIDKIIYKGVSTTSPSLFVPDFTLYKILDMRTYMVYSGTMSRNDLKRKKIIIIKPKTKTISEIGTRLFCSHSTFTTFIDRTTRQRQRWSRTITSAAAAVHSLTLLYKYIYTIYI